MIFCLPSFQTIDLVTTGALGCTIADLFKEMFVVLTQKIPYLHFPYDFILREEE